MEIALPYEVVARNATTQPYLRIAAYKENRVGAPQFLVRGSLILVTLYLKSGSQPAMTEKERRDAESSQTSAPG